MFDNIIVDNLYVKIQEIKKLDSKHQNIKSKIYGYLTMISVITGLSLGIFFITFNIHNLTSIGFVLRLSFVSCMMILIIYLNDKLEKRKDLPNLFKKISKKNILDKLNLEILHDISQSNVQIELLNYFTNASLDCEALKVQFALKEYENAKEIITNMLINVLENRISEIEKIKTQQLIQMYEKDLLAESMPKFMNMC